MKKKFAVVFTVIMAVAAVFGITGCGNSGSGSDKIGVLYLIENSWKLLWEM